MKRILLMLALAVVLVLTFALWRFGASLDDRIARLIESTGSALTGTPVTVSRVDVHLRDGRASIQGFQVGNPEGYPSDLGAMRWEIAQVAIDLASLTRDIHVLNEVEVISPTIHALFLEDGRLNLDEIRRHVRTQIQEKESDAESSAEASGKRLRIEDFHLHGGKILLDASALGVDARQVDLPAVRIHDLGGPNGATTREIGRQILSHTLEAAARALASQQIEQLLSERLPAPVQEQAKDALGEFLERP